MENQFAKEYEAHGDKKSEGRRISTETVYQSYAPESPSTFASKSIEKVIYSFLDLSRFSSGLFRAIFAMKEINHVTEIQLRVQAQ